MEVDNIYCHKVTSLWSGVNDKQTNINSDITGKQLYTTSYKHWSKCSSTNVLIFADVDENFFIILRSRPLGRHFADDIFKCIFLNENVLVSIKISLMFV